MQKVYTNTYRRPSLRFLQKDLDRKKEQVTNRKSARLSKAFAMRNLQLPKETFLIEEQPESISQTPSAQEGKESQTRSAAKNASAHSSTQAAADPKPLGAVYGRKKTFVDLQKEKLQRWKIEQQRKKELAAKKKKPFFNAVHPVQQMPKFLSGISFIEKDKAASKIPKAITSVPTKTFVLRPRPKQDENRPTPQSSIPRTNTGKTTDRTQRAKSATPLMSSNVMKTGSGDLFSANISGIEPVAEDRVSFAPENFKFKGLPHLRNKAVETTRRSSTPLKEASFGSGLSKKAEVEVRRSNRLQDQVKKDTAQLSQAASGTFVVPKTPKRDTQQLAHEVTEHLSGFTMSPWSRTRSSIAKTKKTGDDLMSFTP